MRLGGVKSMQIIDLKQSLEVKRVVLAADSSYKRHKAYLYTFPTSGKQINSYWSGGSKSVYTLVDIATRERRDMPSSSHPYFEIDRVGNITLKYIPDGWALVETGYFCGKVSTATIYVNESNLTKLLGE